MRLQSMRVKKNISSSSSLDDGRYGRSDPEDLDIESSFKIQNLQQSKYRWKNSHQDDWVRSDSPWRILPLRQWMLRTLSAAMRELSIIPSNWRKEGIVPDQAGAILELLSMERKMQKELRPLMSNDRTVEIHQCTQIVWIYCGRIGILTSSTGSKLKCFFPNRWRTALYLYRKSCS